MGKKYTRISVINGKCWKCRASLPIMADVCLECGEQNIYKQRCGNCHTGLEENDRYCRVCGTKVGDGEYEPFENMMYCIYGPRPMKRKHKCRSCGYSWETFAMVDNGKFCPKCGIVLSGSLAGVERPDENESDDED